MKKSILLSFIAFLLFAAADAQRVGINNDGSAPDNSAMLDVKNPNKGFLAPRVALTSTGDVTTIPAPATALLVYNTATAGTSPNDVTPGYYYYNGTAWVKFNTGSAGGAGASNAWLLTGNAGTVDGTNFIGTTDDVPFNVRVNNQRAGRIDGTLGNTFWGYLAGNSITTGGSNTANGAYALQSNSIGSSNTANGVSALQSNTTGSSNTANGRSALQNNTTGSSNTANGNRALQSNTIGANNTANGSFALLSNTTGSSNTANGFYALRFNTTGGSNTAYGFNALLSNTTGSTLTAIGYGADVNPDGLTNATAIGNGAIVDASNKVRIGNANVTVIEGQVPFSNTSDKRFKYDIKNDVPGLEFIKKLTPVTYYFDEKKLDEYTKTGILRQAQDDIAMPAAYTGEKQLHTGFLAQDVEKIAKDLGYEFDGVHAPANNKDHYSLAYSQFIMPLVKGMQEQQVIIEKLTKQVEQSEIPMIIGKQQVIIEEQNKKINKLEKQTEELQTLKAQVEELTKAVKALSHK